MLKLESNGLKASPMQNYSISFGLHCMKATVTINSRGAVTLPAKLRQVLPVRDRDHIVDQESMVMYGRAAVLLRDERMAKLYLGAAGHA